MAREEAFKALSERFKLEPGDTVYTKLNHVSRSGMYRVIDCYVIRDNVPLRMSWSVADVLERRYDRKHEGIAVNGCGMDMGFEVVYALSRTLFGGDGYALTQSWL